jgi:hypothetical protein
MVQPVAIDEREITITPVFKIIQLENIPKSETTGRLVMENHEVVEVRFAGSKNYVPVFPADGMWKCEGNQVFTFAERWPDQYRAFKEGSAQEANGTPLEMLTTFGVTPEQLSLCRALRIYSIEALHMLEGSAAKTLGMNGNALKAAAAAFMADRAKGTDALAEMDALRARIAELEQRSTLVPEKTLTEAEIDQVVKAADEAFVGVSDSEIKDMIASLNDGKRPQGNPSRTTLIQMYEGLQAA